jgi:hypothetical protein
LELAAAASPLWFLDIAGVPEARRALECLNIKMVADEAHDESALLEALSRAVGLEATKLVRFE